MSELLTYRDNLEDILKFSKGSRVLTVSDVSVYTGRDRRWVQKHLGVEPRRGISAATLARRLSK